MVQTSIEPTTVSVAVPLPLLLPLAAWGWLVPYHQMMEEVLICLVPPNACSDGPGQRSDHEGAVAHNELALGNALTKLQEVPHTRRPFRNKRQPPEGRLGIFHNPKGCVVYG